MLTRRRLLTLSAGAVFAPALLPRSALGQTPAANWPSRPVRLVVPFAAGGGTDTVGRLLFTRLSEVWGQPTVVENRGGAGSNVGSEAVARSAPDGYTLLFSGVPLTIIPVLYKSLGYDPVNDLDPVVPLCDYPNLMIVPNSSPAKTVAEFIERAKTQKGMTFGSSGVGTSPHLSGEMFKHKAGIDLTHVAYRGAGPALNDLIPGRIDMLFNNIGSLLTQVRNGSARGLAVSSAQRFFTAPDIPTVAESGLPGFDIMGWYALAAPAGTPREIVDKINADTRTVLEEPAIKQRMEAIGVAIATSSPDEMGARIRREIAMWEPIVKAAGIYKSQ
jgi:tripartite-type tricarboxylate transporter receptor subunit TctC